jgi:hypothetical protein
MMEQKYATPRELGLIFWLRWKLSTKRQRAKIILKNRDLIPEDYITVKCKVCGEKYCFAPYTVIVAPKCKCGNDDIGRATEWCKGKFGNFELVAIEALRFPTLEETFKKFGF